MGSCSSSFKPSDPSSPRLKRQKSRGGASLRPEGSGPPEMPELPHRDSEKKIEEFIAKLKQAETTVEELIIKIKGIVEIVGNQMDKTENNVGLLKRVTYCLNYLNSEDQTEGNGRGKGNMKVSTNYLIHANLTDLIQILLLADLMYHPGTSPKLHETHDEKEMREFKDDCNRWISANLLKEIQVKSSTVSQNKHLIQIIGIMLKVIEDDLGMSNKDEVRIGKADARPHIEKIINS